MKTTETIDANALVSRIQEFQLEECAPNVPTDVNIGVSPEVLLDVSVGIIGVSAGARFHREAGERFCLGLAINELVLNAQDYFTVPIPLPLNSGRLKLSNCNWYIDGLGKLTYPDVDATLIKIAGFVQGSSIFASVLEQASAVLSCARSLGLKEPAVYEDEDALFEMFWRNPAMSKSVSITFENCGGRIFKSLMWIDGTRGGSMEDVKSPDLESKMLWILER